MQTPTRACTAHRLLLTGVILLLLTPRLLAQAEDNAQKKAREPIGEVLGKPVYRDEIRAGSSLRSELHRLFSAPVMRAYRREHREELELTEEEIRVGMDYFNKKHQERIEMRTPHLPEQLEAVEKQLAQDDLTPEKRRRLEREKERLEDKLKPPGRLFAVFWLGNWKVQRHLYERYGGGRILWQQAGLEAFDAMHRWLKAHEEKGDFKITDPELRATFYEYWTTMDHGAFLFGNREQMHKGFLEPEWAPKRQDK